jgi:predicted DsbA family dithiol-disulfide isomerase
VTVIEVYANIWCSFAHVGLRTVIQRRTTLGRDDMALRVRAWPLQLINQRPLDPATTASHVEELRSQVAPYLFAGFDPHQFPRTTLPAPALAAAAYRNDDQTGERVSLALRDALFEHGQDISDPNVLARIADTQGLVGAWPADERHVLSDWDEGRSRGVKGSPHFFCGALSKSSAPP